ncbi:MAG: polysaccharide deacetylase [Verrucomicrobiaceae bacterium]|nr:polysaccharide deacetylase [Verrucomicrobiaceae bacterium]
MLKLDDVVQVRLGGTPVSSRWMRVLDFLTSHHIKGSFGVICESLEKDNPGYFKWLKDLQSGGQIELWMHGYHLKKASEPGEFEQGTFEEQKAILEKAERLAKEKLGFALPAFGPHWTGTTEATDQALEAVPEIKIWLYGPKKPKYFNRLSIERVMALENPTFVPDSAKFQQAYDKSAAGLEVLLLQGHPDQWTDERWAGFLKIIDFLQSKNVIFMTPSEYMNTRQSATK